MVHVTTGNRLDVVYDYENGKKVLKGLKSHDDSYFNGKIIPLPNPRGLISVLAKILDECGLTS